VKRIGENVIEETDKLNGKVVSVTRIALAPDGKSITVSVKDAQDGSSNEFKMRKEQPPPAPNTPITTLPPPRTLTGEVTSS
jgi:hypothetical protein